jgi:hypothetical protein
MDLEDLLVARHSFVELFGPVKPYRIYRLGIDDIHMAGIYYNRKYKLVNNIYTCSSD